MAIEVIYAQGLIDIYPDADGWEIAPDSNNLVVKEKETGSPLGAYPGGIWSSVKHAERRGTVRVSP